MKLFIAEDEPPARERLIATLARVAPNAVVLGTADTVRGCRQWLELHAPPDLLLLDIQLADGLSLELFREPRWQGLPVVFTTAYDRFAIEAFQALAVDYLLKPIGDTALARALDKAQRLHGGSAAIEGLLARLLPPPAPLPRRLLGRRGNQFHALCIEQVAYFTSIDKLSYAVLRDGQRYGIEAPLAELEAQLDPAQFFRANRQLIVAAAAVQRFWPSGRGRLALVLEPEAEGEMQISQERAAAFKQWLGGAP